jgi:hypothetical protein
MPPFFFQRLIRISGLSVYRPHWAYLLLDEGAIAQNDAYSPEVRNLAAALFQLEKARDEATWLAVYQRLVAALDSAALDSLKRAFGRWIYRSFIRKKRPGIRLPDIDDFHEAHAMLQQRVEQWNETIREQGRQEGRRKTALAMIQRTGLDDATIANVTELSIDEVQQLRNKPTHH